MLDLDRTDDPSVKVSIDPSISQDSLIPSNLAHRNLFLQKNSSDADISLTRQSRPDAAKSQTLLRGTSQTGNTLDQAPNVTDVDK